MRFLYLRSPINQTQDINCEINGRIDEGNMLDFFSNAELRSRMKKATFDHKSYQRFYTKSVDLVTLRKS